MSAWLVTKDHIDALVQALVTEGIIPVSEATSTGRLMWAENRASLYARYGDEFDHEANDAYKFRGIEAELDDAKIAAAISCLDYQACESGDRGLFPSGLPWEKTLAFTLLDRLAAQIASRADVNPQDLYLWWEEQRSLRRDRDEAGWWGIDDIEQALLDHHQEVPNA